MASLLDIFAASKPGGPPKLMAAPFENPSPSLGQIPVQFFVTLLLASSSWRTLNASSSAEGLSNIKVIRSPETFVIWLKSAFSCLTGNPSLPKTRTMRFPPLSTSMPETSIDIFSSCARPKRLLCRKSRYSNL